MHKVKHKRVLTNLRIAPCPIMATPTLNSLVMWTTTCSCIMNACNAWTVLDAVKMMTYNRKLNKYTDIIWSDNSVRTWNHAINWKVNTPCAKIWVWCRHIMNVMPAYYEHHLGLNPNNWNIKKMSMCPGILTPKLKIS